MKIGQPADKPVQGTTTTPASPARTGDAAKGQAASAVPAGADGEASAKVVLSDAASALLSASGAVSGDFDAAKVERIGKAIAEGSFKANPEAIADKLIANTQELLRKHSH